MSNSPWWNLGEDRKLATQKKSPWLTRSLQWKAGGGGPLPWMITTNKPPGNKEEKWSSGKGIRAGDAIQLVEYLLGMQEALSWILNTKDIKWPTYIIAPLRRWRREGHLCHISSSRPSKATWDSLKNINIINFKREGGESAESNLSLNY